MPAYAGGVPSGQAVAGTAVRHEKHARNPRLAPAGLRPATFQARQIIQRKPAATVPSRRPRNAACNRSCRPAPACRRPTSPSSARRGSCRPSRISTPACPSRLRARKETRRSNRHTPCLPPDTQHDLPRRHPEKLGVQMPDTRVSCRPDPAANQKAAGRNDAQRRAYVAGARRPGLGAAVGRDWRDLSRNQ